MYNTHSSRVAKFTNLMIVHVQMCSDKTNKLCFQSIVIQEIEVFFALKGFTATQANYVNESK